MIVMRLISAIPLSMETKQVEMTRREIRKILRRNRGSQTEVARRAGVKLQTVNQWVLSNSTSANISHHARAVARELLEKELRADAA